MNEKFSTKRLMDAISAGMLRHAEEDAIIARLRAADRLCEVAKVARRLLIDEEWYETADKIREAIVEYEGGQ